MKVVTYLCACIQIPTFFDSDADGIVKLEDTRKGLISLGLQDDYANYAAYALHLIFSFSTSNSWIPSLDRTLSVNISKMNNTRWGKNWGTYERVSWCFDINIETVGVSLAITLLPVSSISFL